MIKIISLFYISFLWLFHYNNFDLAVKSENSPRSFQSVEPSETIKPSLLRYVIKTSYYNLKINDSKHCIRIINLKGKIIKEWGNEFKTPQSFDCLNYPNGKLYLYSWQLKKLLSIDRDGNEKDMSEKYKNISLMGQDFVALGRIESKEGYDIYNPNGEFVFNSKDIQNYTKFSDDVISVYQDNSWEIRDTGWQLLHKFPSSLQTYEDYPNKGLHPSSNGLIRIDRAKGNHYFVDKYGRTVLDLYKLLDVDVIMQVTNPSEGIVLVKHESLIDMKVKWSYIDTSGNIIWSINIDRNEEAAPFSGGFARINYNAVDIDSLWAEANLRGDKSVSVPMATKMINKKGEVVQKKEDMYAVYGRKGKLFLTRTVLNTIDNRMFGYAIVDDETKKIVFDSEWPILYFDEHVVMVGHKDVYARELSSNLIVYDYKKKPIWKTPKIVNYDD